MECCRQAVIDDSSAAEEQGGLRRLEAAERRARGSYEYFKEAARAGGRSVGEGGSQVGRGRQLRDWDSRVKESLISEGGLGEGKGRLERMSGHREGTGAGERGSEVKGDRDP